MASLITIVDDDESVGNSLCDLLEVLGYSVQAFSSPHDAIASHQISAAKCFVFDILMPGQNGVELYDGLSRRGIDIPVVFITAHAGETLINDAERLGPCLIKPFGEKALSRATENLLHAAPSAAF